MLCPRCVSKPVAGSGPYRGHASSAVQETRTELLHEQHPSGVEIDRCRTCSGAFLDRGELEKIERHARRAGDRNTLLFAMFKRANQACQQEARHGPSVGTRSGRGRSEATTEATNERAHRPSDGTPEPESIPTPCPGCSEPMFEREWAKTPVMVDVCLECRGIWVDGGELEAIESFFGV